MDIIFIRELRVATVIGVYDWERRIHQTLNLDLELAADIRQAATSDRIEDTLSYKEVAKRVSEFVAASEFQLLEALADNVVELVRREFGVPWVRLRVAKPGAVTGAREVGVIVERGRRD